MTVVNSLKSLIEHHENIINTCTQLIQTHLKYAETANNTRWESECNEAVVGVRYEKVVSIAAIKRLKTIINN